MAQITDLPPEILSKIFTEHGLECRDLAQAARVCTAFSREATRANFLHNIEYERSSILILAAQQGRLDWAQKALAAGAMVNTVSPGCGETREQLDFIFKEGESLGHRDFRPSDGKEYGTPLHYAALRGDNEMIALLLESGADLRAASYKLCDCLHDATLGKPSWGQIPRWFPLHHAMCRAHESTANILLHAGAPLNLCCDVECEALHIKPLHHHSLIHSAAASGLDKLVQHAIDVGTDPSMETEESCTALHFTSRSWNSEAVIQILVSHGVELDYPDLEDRPALVWAYKYGNLATAIRLLKAGATPSNVLKDQRDDDMEFKDKVYDDDILQSFNYQWNPVAVPDGPKSLDEWNKEQAVFLRTLIEDGLDIHERLFDPEQLPEDLRCALSIATRTGSQYLNPEAVALLLEKGVDPNLDSTLEQLLDEIDPTEEWYDRQFAEKIRRVIYMLIEHGARVGLVDEDTMGSVKEWVENEAVHTDDRDLFKYLLGRLGDEGELGD
ncbi:hypothetical protein VPNG_07615 [Cytospora leucostoma]|uniref:F-box domain-containing protein n=1 Tax=Cytospora leucostoma TaxID=1230097 RepID=A0A423WDA2_9PEZI|nr:hypothetical protein VPNG_07615 [Cytospora leucostoma]